MYALKLSSCYVLKGGTQEARALIEESWPGAADRSDVLKRFFLLEDAAVPRNYVTEALRRGDAE